ncbi:hypothetical protein NDU88_005343 [Pleurodeles waltl]|uniref:Uncharacterized protein n=1 Tax=Pleurodeles waltl TaxID=8319 RepID=A0AAV7MA62_PLEWA|nr:hypothetical protein NDU88_005343 [Pleurodeles waltl]
MRATLLNPDPILSVPASHLPAGPPQYSQFWHGWAGLLSPLRTRCTSVVRLLSFPGWSRPVSPGAWARDPLSFQPPLVSSAEPGPGPAPKGPVAAPQAVHRPQVLLPVAHVCSLAHPARRPLLSPSPARVDRHPSCSLRRSSGCRMVPGCSVRSKAYQLSLSGRGHHLVLLAAPDARSV